MFFAHLSQYYITQKRISELESKERPELKLVGIDSSNNISENAAMIPFNQLVETDCQSYLTQIKMLYAEINGIILDDRFKKTKETFGPLYSFVKISNDLKESLNCFAKEHEIPISESFFDLGSLREERFTVDISGKRYMQGTNAEKRKYHLIMDLKKTIVSYLQWSSVENAFSPFKCVKFAMDNSGTTYDEDVEITLFFPNSSILTPESFPQLNDHTMKYLLDNLSIQSVFGIAETEQYHDYQSSTKRIPKASSIKMPFESPDYEKEFKSEIEDTFCYSFFPNNETCVVKLKIGYIKQHTAVAFPTVLLLCNTVSEVKYTISSKHYPDITEGKITIL